MIRILALCLTLATPALGDVARVVEDHILPGAHRFAVQTRALAVNAQADCTAPGVIPSYHNVFDAWMGISHLAFGPLEYEGRALAIAFWPDKRGMVAATVARLVKDQDAIVRDPERFGDVSVAGRGLFALERLLFDAAHAGYGRDDYTCSLVQAIAQDLSRMGAEIAAGWADHTGLMLGAGQAGNTTYLAPKEADQRLYTVLLAALEFDADQRLGRPLGTFDRPRPTRAEARRSGRSLRNLELSLAALKAMAEAMATAPIPATRAAFDQALQQARDLPDPVFGSVVEPISRLKVEILQQSVQAIGQAVTGEIGAQLGVAQGFNSADGD